MKTELLPCPFCGSTHSAPSQRLDVHFVHCKGCGAEGPPHTKASEAVANWNARTFVATERQTPYIVKPTP